jgi:hypothetical protein
MSLSLEKFSLKNESKNLIPSFIFSTTRSWNPGDDFIFYGVRNLIENFIPKFNNFIYDRNPEYHFLRNPTMDPGFDKNENNLFFVNFESIARKIPSFRNSLGLKDSLSNIDLAIFSGTPEWAGRMLEPFNEFILKNKIPIIHLGLGCSGIYNENKFSSFSDLDQEVMKKSLLITTRDQFSNDIFPFKKNVQVLSCPALFASKTATKRTQKKKIALSIQGVKGAQSISEEMFNYSIELFKELVDLFDCEIVCHYKEDYNSISSIFGSLINIYYSSEPKDYFEIYKDFDLTVTTRVHGAGICASMGIPGVCLSHTARMETVKGFLSEIINPKETSVKEAVKLIQDLDVPKRSEEIINLKSQMLQEYQKLLKPVFQNLNFI